MVSNIQRGTKIKIIKDSSGKPKLKLTDAKGKTRVIEYDERIAGSLIGRGAKSSN